MIRPLLAGAIAGLVAGCTASDGRQRGPLEQAPIDSADMRGDYQRIAGCAYAKFVDGTSNVMNRNEFPELKQTRLAMGGASKAWELVLTQTAPGQTHVDLTAVQTMWGPDKLSTRDVMRDLMQACDGLPANIPKRKR